MCVIYVAESHDQILRLWQKQNSFSLRILHLDFHCDMRGLLIDRTTKIAYSIWDMKPGIDQGNFLTHAIIEGRIESIRWVYDTPGGRQYDVGTVKFESDFTAIRYRVINKLKKTSGIPIDFEVIKYSNWTGLTAGEYLDIDWDFFASDVYSPATIQNRVEVFLAKEIHAIPNQIYVCYSPEFSHPSRDQFWHFVENLAQIYKAEVIQLEPDPVLVPSLPFYKKYIPSFLFQVIRQVYYGINLGLRKLGIY